MAKNKLLVPFVAVSAVVIIAAVYLFMQSRPYVKPHFAVYLSGNELIYHDLDKEDTRVLSDKAINTEIIETSEIEEILNNNVFLTDEGVLLYPADINATGYTLYSKDMKKNGEAVKIADNMWEYHINGEDMVYRSGDAIFGYDLKEQKGDKIADIDVWMYDDKGVAYTKAGNAFYYTKELGSVPVKDRCTLLSNVDGHVYLKSDDGLYYYEGGTPKKVETEIADVVDVTESGAVLYTSKQTEWHKLSEFVEDDLYKSDDDIKEPVPPEQPSSTLYNTYEEFEPLYKEYSEKLAEYRKQKEAYEDMLARDELRLFLDKEEKSIDSVTLYMNYMGEEKVLTSAFANGPVVSKGGATLFGQAVNEEKDKLKISDLSTDVNVAKMTINNYLDEVAVSLYIYTGESRPLGIENAKDIYVDGENIYAYSPDIIKKKKRDKGSEQETGTLYLLSAGETDVFDEGVREDIIAGGGIAAYYKVEGELYVNKEKIADNVKEYSVANGEVRYLTENGELHLLNGSDDKLLTDSADELFDGGLFIKNRNNESFEGILCLTDGTEIAQGVRASFESA